MGFNMQKGMGEDTQLKLAKFLTEFEEDINCRIEAPETLMAQMLYRMMEARDRKYLEEEEEGNGKPSSGMAADKLQRLSWSIRGMSRGEGVEALRRVPGSNIRGPAQSYSYRPESSEGE